LRTLTAILRLFSAGCTSVKGKIWVIYRKFSGKLPVNLPVIYGNGNIPNFTGNFRTLVILQRIYKAKLSTHRIVPVRTEIKALQLNGLNANSFASVKL